MLTDDDNDDGRKMTDDEGQHPIYYPGALGPGESQNA